MAHVLIADDEDDLRATLRILLEEEGHCVSEARTGPDALAALREASAGRILLLSLTLRGMDGVQLLRVLQCDEALARRHAYVVLSANTGALWNDALPLVAALGGYMTRTPFDIDEFTAIIDEAARRLDARLDAR